MFIFILALILLVPLALAPAMIDEIFSPDDLYLMGISLGNSEEEVVYCCELDYLPT